MIKVLCDKCGDDCDLNAYEIRVANIHNPCPVYPLDIGDLKITDSHEHFRFILCQRCYRKFGFPNIYEVTRTKELKFRNLEGRE